MEVERLSNFNLLIADGLGNRTVEVDSNGDDVFYEIDLGDGTNSGWIETGEATHKWTVKDTYGVKVKAKDILDFESD